MKKIYSAVLGADSGTVVLFSDFKDQGPMWASDGARETVVHVSFSEPFKEPPTVFVSLNLFDFSNEANIRFEMNAVNVSDVGFDIEFKTWGDTKIARARASWMATGPVAADDDWML